MRSILQCLAVTTFGQWYWDNRQRTIDDHCGVIGGIWIDVPSAGRHTVEFSMREDGFIMDAFHLTLSSEMPDVLREENETSAQMKINKMK